MKSILWITAILVAVVCLFGGCKKDDSGDATKTTSPATSTKAPQTSSATKEATATPSATPAPTRAPVTLTDPPAGYDENDKAPAADLFDLVFENGTAKDKSAAKREVTPLNDPAIADDPAIGKTAAECIKGDVAGSDVMFASYDFGSTYETLAKGFTFEAYAKISDITQYGTIFANMQAGGLGFDFEPSTSTTPFNAGGNASIGFNIYDSGRAQIEGFDAPGYVNLYADQDIEEDRYYHVVATFDGQTLKLYYDGVLLKSADVIGPIQFPKDEVSQYLGIGGDAGETEAGELAINGSIAIARIYSTALTDSQVYNLYADAVK